MELKFLAISNIFTNSYDCEFTQIGLQPRRSNEYTFLAVYNNFCSTTKVAIEMFSKDSDLKTTINNFDEFCFASSILPELKIKVYDLMSEELIRINFLLNVLKKLKNRKNITIENLLLLKYSHERINDNGIVMDRDTYAVIDFDQNTIFDTALVLNRILDPQTESSRQIEESLFIDALKNPHVNKVRHKILALLSYLDKNSYEFNVAKYKGILTSADNSESKFINLIEK